MKVALALIVALAVAVYAQNNEGKHQHVKLPRNLQFAEEMPVPAGLIGNHETQPLPQMERRGGDKGGKGGSAPPPPPSGWGWGPPPGWGWGWGGPQG